tara:strand:+ start:9209 stop:11704 length:2496 start_codon:yes stop_codon:yes gene_type:complete
MRKILFIVLYLSSFLISRAQIDISGNSLSSFTHNFIPSSFSPKDLKPSDIPSKLVLKQMGLSDKEIEEALKYKEGTGKYEISSYDSTNLNIQTKESILHNIFSDSLIDSTIYPVAKVYGQDIFRNSNISFFQKSLDAKAPENYKVGTGDEISISVWGYNEFSENLLVDERGYISPSSYGRIYVKGLSFKKMRSMLKSRFSNFFDMKNSEIDVTLSYSRVITVNIVGEVYHPGSYSIPAINTAFNALIAAKGPTQIGSVRNIYIKRGGEIVDSLDVYSFLFNPNKDQDIYLQDGDYIYVPPAGNLVEVIGAVNRPYTYESKKGETVDKLINYSGGFTKKAYKDIVTLKTIDYNKIKVNDIYKDDRKLVTVKNGDEIIINSISNRISNLVTVDGSIGVSGDYEYINGERLLDLLNRAKCISEKTFLKKVYIIRLNDDKTKSHISVNLESVLKNNEHEDNILLKEYDIVKVLSVDDFTDEFSVYVEGAVRDPGILKFGEGITLQDVLLQSGGLTQQSIGSRIEISRILDYDVSSNKIQPIRSFIKSFVIKPDFTSSIDANYELQPYDQIFVRENPNFNTPKNVVVSGEVKYPGAYSLLQNDETIYSVIKRSGGLTEFAHLSAGKVYRKKKSKKLKNNQIDMKIPDYIIDTIGDNYKILNAIYLEELNNKNNLYVDTTINELVSFDLKKALSKKSSKHNIVLEEGDSIVISKKLDVVQINGDLNNLKNSSISAPFLGKRAHYYVKNYGGGYSLDNKKSNTTVIYPNGATKKTLNLGLFTLSPKIEPGSTIKVSNDYSQKKKQRDIDYDRHIQSVITKITAVISLTLLIDRLKGSF